MAYKDFFSSAENKPCGKILLFNLQDVNRHTFWSYASIPTQILYKLTIFFNLFIQIVDVDGMI